MSDRSVVVRLVAFAVSFDASGRHEEATDEQGLDFVS